MSRIGDVERTTKETKIKLTLNLDGEGKGDIATGIGFFDHMLGSFARHGFFDLKVQADGDLNVDTHHTVEDVGIVLGTALKEALGDKKSIRRFGSCILPMATRSAARFTSKGSGSRMRTGFSCGIFFSACFSPSSTSGISSLWDRAAEMA